METLYIIQGTGFGIDGTVVKVVRVEGDYSIVSPPNINDAENLMVKTKCLRSFGKKQSFTYTINVTKDGEDGYTETCKPLIINNAFRDVKLTTITEFIENALSPILRME